MEKNLLKFDHCPFCSRGDGTIAVDTAAALTWCPPAGQNEETLINHAPDQPVVLFMDRQEISKPCEHLAYLLLDVGRGTGPTWANSFTLTWLNADLLEGAPPYSRLNDVWEMVVEKAEPAQVLVTPYRVRRPVRECEVVEPIQSDFCLYYSG